MGLGEPSKFHPYYDDKFNPWAESHLQHCNLNSCKHAVTQQLAAMPRFHITTLKSECVCPPSSRSWLLSLDLKTFICRFHRPKEDKGALIVLQSNASL